MKINASLLAFAATAAMGATIPEAEVIPDMDVYSASVAKVERAAFAVNDILKRHAEAETSCSELDSFCEQQRQALDSVAGSAIDGYGALVARHSHKKVGKRGTTHWNHKKYGKNSQFWKDRFGFTGAPGSPTGSKVKRDYPESLIAHCDNDASYCNVESFEPFLLKRDASPEDVAKTMQPDGVGETLIAIRDAVDFIKREAEVEGADDEVEMYFEDLEEKVKRAVARLED